MELNKNNIERSYEREVGLEEEELNVYGEGLEAARNAIIFLEKFEYETYERSAEGYEIHFYSSLEKIGELLTNEDKKELIQDLWFFLTVSPNLKEGSKEMVENLWEVIT